MANTVSTTFIAQDVESYIKKLESADNALDSLSATAKRSSFSTDFKKLTDEIQKSLSATEKSVTSLKTTTEAQKIQPTISSFYRGEADKVQKSLEDIKRGTAQVEAANARLAAIEESRKAGNLAAQEVSRKRSSVLSEISDRINPGDSDFNSGAAFRKVGAEADKAAAKVANLRGKTTELQRTFLELADDFAPVGLNRPFNAVGREVFGAVNAAGAAGAAGEETLSSASRTAALLRVRETALGVKKAEVAVTTALAAAELGDATAKGTVTAATVSLAAANSAAAGAATALAAAEAEVAVGAVGIGAALTAIAAPLAIGAAAALVAYHIVSDVRNETERRLKVEEQIAATLNKQLFSAKQLTFEFNQQESNAKGNRDFTRSTTGETVEQLETRKRNLESRISLLPKTSFTADGKDETSQFFANELATKRQEVSQLNKLIDERKDKDKKDRDEAYKNNGDNFTKSQEQARKFQDEKVKQDNERLAKRTADIKSATEKVESLGKRYTETFDNLFVSTSKNNPFASVFSEADRAADKLRENLKGLSPELRAIADKLQSKSNADKLFSTRLDNDFSAFDLRQRASDLRSFKPAQIEDTGKFLADFTAAAIKAAIAANGGSSVRYNRTANGGFSQTNVSDEFTKSYDLVSKKDGSFGGFSSRTRSFADLTEKEKLEFLNKDNIGFQNRFSASLDLAQNRKALNPEQQGEIDRKVLALSSGVDVSKLTDQQRDLMATAAERQATAREKAEQLANKFRQDSTLYLKNINEYIEGLKQKAATGGSQVLEITLKDETSAGVEAKKSAKTATSADTQEYYNQGLYNNTTGGAKGLSSF